MTKFISRSARETRRIGADFAKKLSSPKLIGLTGEIGSGKTTFVQGMARGLGIAPRYDVHSPTFTMVNEYRNLIHVDLYRIEQPEEILTLALEEYLRPGQIVVIEWAEKARQKFDFEVQFEYRGEKERRISIKRTEEGSLPE